MTLPPEQWAKATAALTMEAFEDEIRQIREQDRLVAYIEYEAERPHGTRPERIGVCNKRLQRLRD
jgi:hypothetical protein